MLFRQQRQKFVDKKLEISVQCSKKFRKSTIYFRKKAYFSSTRFFKHMESSFENPANTFDKKQKELSSWSRKQKWPIFEKNSPNLFLWTRRMHLWQPRQKLFDEKFKIFRPISEND